jgi:hypothetical protein
MRRVLAADAAELFQLQPLRHSLSILGRRIVPLFAITALQRNDFSGHKNTAPSFSVAISRQLLASSSNPNSET